MPYILKSTTSKKGISNTDNLAVYGYKKSLKEMEFKYDY